MIAATGEAGPGCGEVPVGSRPEDDDLIDDLQQFWFAWPTAEDCRFAAQRAELNAFWYGAAEVRELAARRTIVIARHDHDEGERAAAALAAECLRQKAYAVHVWAVPGYGTEFPDLETRQGRYNLLAELAIERACEWKNFVSFVSDPRGERPRFEGEPKPIAAELEPVPPLLPSMIPEPFQAWCLDIAERLGCPLEYVATPLVVVLSGVIGRRIAIRPKRMDDWKEVANLWGALVGPPGSMKTPAIAEVCRPLKVLDAEEKDRHRREVEEHREDALVASVKRSAAKKAMNRAAKDGADGDALKELAREAVASGDEEGLPEMRRHFLNDITNEKLGELMAQEVNSNGLIVFRDELVGFLRTLGRQGHEADKAFYMEAWNGKGSFTFDRIGRGTIHIPHACLALFGGIQPGPLASYLRGAFSGEENDGFIQRFQVMMYPDPPRQFDYQDRWPLAEARDRAVAVFRALDALDPMARGCTAEDETGIPSLRFDDEAQEFFFDWWHDLEGRVRSGSLTSQMATHLSKYRKLMPALSLIFHLVETYDRPMLGPVGLRPAMAAAAWCHLLERHAHRIYRAAMDGDLDAAVRLSERLAGSLPNPFSPRDLYRKCWAGLTTVEETRRALAVLEDRNWIKVVEVEPEGRGRPTELCWVHPRVQAKREARS